MLAAVLAAARGSLPHMFSSDTLVLGLCAAMLPWVAASQPLNALAFVWDGVLFGAGGFRYASLQMALAAIPGITLMVAGPQIHGGAAGAAGAAGPEAKLAYVWAGLMLVMAGRAAGIWVPWTLKLPPFAGLLAQAQEPQRQGGRGGDVPH